MSDNQWVSFVRTKIFRREYAHIIAQVVAFIILLAAAALLTSCGDSPTATSTPATVAPTSIPTIAPTTAPAITVPTATAGTDPTASQTNGATEGTDSMDIPEELKIPYAAAIADITKRNTQISASSLKLTGYSSEQFSDSSLGCPKPNTMYTQVITAGYILNIQGGNTTYIYHTNRTGNRIVLCTPSSSPVLPANP